ncbi:MAG: glutathione peroxidase [Bacteroidales bacterium]|nr:glutathione peroxidase [Bacteroidales bacterium]
MTGPLQHTITGIDGKKLDLAQYKGKVVLIVNVASECGYTPQYEGLQTLFQKYEKEGLVVLGVPSNDFGRQEPGSEADIMKFCRTNYSVTFPMTAKMILKGDQMHALYKALIAADPNPKTQGKEVGWNFEKFLVDRKGHVVARFTSGVEPTSDELVQAVTKALKP